MIHYISTYKWILFGICFLVVFVGLCSLWYQHSVGIYEQELLEFADVVMESDYSVKVHEASSPSETLIVEPIDLTPNTLTQADNKQGFTSEHQEEVNKTSPSQPVQIAKSEKGEERVSPHGFGPYPEIPPNYPRQDLWDYPDYVTASHELLLRVQIKLWKQGVQTIGGALINGKIYLNLPNTVYTRWKNRVLPDGTNERYATRVSGNPQIGRMLAEIIDSKGELQESDIPPGVTVIDSDDGGIDPYQFLGL